MKKKNCHKRAALFKVCACGGRMHVTDSRAVLREKDSYIRRRYQCIQCGSRFSTAERIHDFEIGRRLPVMKRAAHSAGASGE